MIRNKKRIIFVNCTAASVGGALTVFVQFLDSIETYDSVNMYYIFCNTPGVDQYNKNNIKIINKIYKRKWIGRFLWDNFGIKNWAKTNNLKPDLIISLQNTGVNLGKKVKQIIYYHQSLPMYEYKWSLWNKKERILWFYKNLYPWFVKRCFYRDDVLVVQSDWMKEACSKVLNIQLNHIKVIRPSLQVDSLSVESDAEFQNLDGFFSLIYPASGMEYKNHMVIIEALKQISRTRQDIINNLRFYTTLDTNISEKYQPDSLKENIVFWGNIEFSELLQLYRKADIMVFPSYLETVGLPLLEAAFFGLPIVASDLPYAREAVFGYEGARFVKFNDPSAWANEIIRAYENRKKYSSFTSNKKDTWSDFFELIREQVK